MIFNWLKKMIKQEKYVKARSLRRQANNELDPIKAEKLYQQSDRLFFQTRNEKKKSISKHKNYYTNNGFVKFSKDKNFNANLNFKK